LKELTLVEPYLEEFCGDVVMGGAASSIWHIKPIYTKPLDSMPISSPLLTTTPSYAHAFLEFLGDIRGYSPSFDPYCAIRSRRA